MKRLDAPVSAPGSLAGPAGERYLAEVTARLAGPVSAHSGIVAELRASVTRLLFAMRAARRCLALRASLA